MLLVFDVGNTNIVLGLYDGDKMIYHWRAATNELKTADEYAASLGMMFQLDGVTFDMVTDIIISSVVPPVNPTLEYLCRRYFHVEPMMVGPGMKTGLNILYDNPAGVGGRSYCQCRGRHYSLWRPSDYHRSGNGHYILCH